MDPSPRGTVLGERDGTPRPASPYGVRTTGPDLAEALDTIESGHDPVGMGARDKDPGLAQFWPPDPLYFALLELCASDPVDCNPCSPRGCRLPSGALYRGMLERLCVAASGDAAGGRPGAANLAE